MGPPRGHPSVVAQQVNRAEGLQGPVRQGLDLLFPGYVGSHGQYRGAGAAQFLDGRVQGGSVHVGHHYLHAFAQAAPGQAKPDAAGLRR